MTDRTTALLEAMRGVRRSPGYSSLGSAERRALDRDMRRIEEALRPSDPYALPFESDLERDIAAHEQAPRDRGAPANVARTPPATPKQDAAATAPAAKPGTEVLGDRARRVLDAVDFSAFVAGLVTGTFRSIVDATGQQVREYANLVASISKSVDEFSRENVTPNQVRDWLSDRYPKDLQLVLPEPGKGGAPRIVPRPGRGSDPPAWLDRYGLGGAEFTEELTEGELIEAGRRSLGEERMQTLATMVLMGINRIVVSDGQIRAKLVFHAAGDEKVGAEVSQQGGGQQVGFAARSGAGQTAVTTMVSTVNVNAQADVAIKADLTGEVMIQFRTESFPLERFADSAAIQLINRHARWQGDGAGGAPAAAPAPAPAAGGAGTGGGGRTP